jgi:GrpB-like predicted nucleotidyltransferase (UPF0157 family)
MAAGSHAHPARGKCLTSILERPYLRKRGAPNFNFAVTADGGDFCNTQIIVRNFLRTQPAETAGYVALKRLTYDKGAHLFSACSQTKEPFLAALRAREEGWHSLLARTNS